MSSIHINDVVFTYLLRYELNFKVCGVMNGLLRMYGVVGFHMLIELVDKYWGHQQGLIIMYIKEIKIFTNGSILR